MDSVRNSQRQQEIMFLRCVITNALDVTEDILKVGGGTEKEKTKLDVKE